MLRLAPNLQVAHTSASDYVITARGLNGNSNAQNFANKLLVLIDGRTVYTPLFSGVYWDMQDVLPEDIDRIEVISGPGATCGAPTRSTASSTSSPAVPPTTQGGCWSTARRRRASDGVGLRYGGRLGDDRQLSALRQARSRTTSTRTGAGAAADDRWTGPQGGFRARLGPGARDTVTLQGDAYQGARSQARRAGRGSSGGNLLGALEPRLASGARPCRCRPITTGPSAATTVGASGVSVDTYDLDVQHSFALGGRTRSCWGGGVPREPLRVSPAPRLAAFSPRRGATQLLSNVFVQDSIALDGRARPLIARAEARGRPLFGRRSCCRAPAWPGRRPS